MISIIKKDITSYFTSSSGYIIIGSVLTLFGLLLWVLPETSFLYQDYADLYGFFGTIPILFSLLIPALSMRSISQEIKEGTFHIIQGLSLTIRKIIWSKFLAILTVAVLALIPTLIYYWSISQIALPIHNVDHGAIIGSYLGIVLLTCLYVSLGILASCISSTQVSAFLIGTIFCFTSFYLFGLISSIPALFGGLDRILPKFGAAYYYDRMSLGILDFKSCVYFISTTIIVLEISTMFLKRKLDLD